MTRSANFGLTPGSEYVVASIGRVPPPPLDTNYVALSDGGSSTGTARFFINRTANNAWVVFNDGSGPGAAPTGRIQFRNNGTIKGTGTLALINANGAASQLDLSTASFTGSIINGACAEPPKEDTRPAPCASIPFTGVTTAGTPVTGAIGVGTAQIIRGDGGQIG